jgi:hypothetical protein
MSSSSTQVPNIILTSKVYMNMLDMMNPSEIQQTVSAEGINIFISDEPKTTDDVNECIRTLDYFEADMSSGLIEYAFTASFEDIAIILGANLAKGNGMQALASSIAVLQSHRCLPAINTRDLKCLKLIYEKYGEISMQPVSDERMAALAAAKQTAEQTNTVEQAAEQTNAVDKTNASKLPPCAIQITLRALVINFYDGFEYLVNAGHYDSSVLMIAIIAKKIDYIKLILSKNLELMNDNIIDMIFASYTDNDMHILEYLVSVGYKFRTYMSQHANPTVNEYMMTHRGPWF